MACFDYYVSKDNLNSLTHTSQSSYAFDVENKVTYFVWGLYILQHSIMSFIHLYIS